MDHFSLLHRLRVRLVGAPISLTLIIILLLGLVPALVMGSYFIKSGLADIQIAQREMHGLEVLRHLQPVDEFINNVPDDNDEMRKQAGLSWNVLNQMMKHGGQADLLDSRKHVAAVLAKLRVNIEGQQADAKPSFDALLRRVADQSGLILDPELESYYLMDIVVLKSRRLAHAAQEREAINNLSGDTRAQLLLISRHRMSDAAHDLQSAALSAVRGNTDGTLQRSNLLPSIGDTITAANAMIAGGNTKNAYQRLIAANRKSWIAAANALDRALAARKDKIETEMTAALVVCGGVIIMVLTLAGLVIAAITGSLRRLSQRLDMLSLGDYESEIPGVEFGNDIGVIAGALQHFVTLSGQIEAERMTAKAELEQTVTEVRRENDALLRQALDRQAEAQKVEREAVARLAQQLETQMSDLLAGSRTAAHQMDREASMMAESTSGVQREASAAAIAANEIRRSVEAVTPEVRAVAEQLQGYTQSLGEAKDLAKDAVKRVDIAKDRIAEFDHATGRAGAMLDLIAKVAHKTNMLALNASIEAVRVGEAGQGFMVVAEEVKALARSTRDAAQEISSQIKAMESANNAVAGAFGEVLEAVNVLALQSDNVASGMTDQAFAIDQVNFAINAASSELSTMVSSINGADRSATIAIERSAEMLLASKSVSDSVGTLDKSVRDFLGGLQSTRRLVA